MNNEREHDSGGHHERDTSHRFSVMDGRPRLKTFQTCDAERKSFTMTVPSASDPGTSYTIEGWFTEGLMTCTCPGFKFRGTCKHLTIKDERCGWNALESPEPQTMEQKTAHICPRCGSRTADTMRGDF